MKISGIYIPVVTPFRDDEIDFISLKKLIDYFCEAGVTGIIPAATTGEGPVLSDKEYRLLLSKTIEFTAGRIQVFAGASGNNTKDLCLKIRSLGELPLSGILSATPFYNLPDQRGIYAHFLSLSEHTNFPIILYNIPGRTGRNMENDTVRRLAELKNIVGLKDSCANIDQSMELLLDPPHDFSILAGHDAHFFLNLALGGNGGILASAHVSPGRFMELYRLAVSGDFQRAREIWKDLMRVIPLLFREPNPAPVKFILAKQGLMTSDEVRLPLMRITEELEKKLAFTESDYA